jgi:hypothetical protein
MSEEEIKNNESLSYEERKIDLTFLFTNKMSKMNFSIGIDLK